MKQIFFKTVREDGSSVWAIGKYKTIYVVGQHYRFNPRTPAHVFGLSKFDGLLYPENENDLLPEQSINHNLVYQHRAENHGNRVLIGYGEVKTQKVLCCPTGIDWDFRQAEYKWRFVSSEFDIIGEIKPDAHELMQSRWGSHSYMYEKCKIAFDIDQIPLTKT